MDEKRIILLGCGEHARMVIDNIEQSAGIRLVGLVASLPEDVGMSVLGYPVLCVDDEIPKLLAENPDINGYFLGMGNMKVRSRVALRMYPLLPAVNILHPAAIISKHAVLGAGNLLEAYTKVANGAIIGSHCIVNSFTSVNHDQEIGDNVLLAGCVSLAGKRIGDNTIVADGASIGFKRSVGRNCIIGDGAVVAKDIPDNSVAYGNPARVVRSNDWE